MNRFGPRCGECRAQSRGELLEPDRLRCRRQRGPDGPGVPDGDLQQRPGAVPVGGPVGDDEPIPAHNAGTVDDHRQTRKQCGMPLQPVDERGEPSPVRAHQQPVRRAEGRRRLSARSRRHDTGEQPERGGAPLPAQQIGHSGALGRDVHAPAAHASQVVDAHLDISHQLAICLPRADRRVQRHRVRPAEDLMPVPNTHSGRIAELDQVDAREQTERCGPVRVSDGVPGNRQCGPPRPAGIQQSPFEDRPYLAGQVRAGAGDRLPEGLIGPDWGKPRPPLLGGATGPRPHRKDGSGRTSTSRSGGGHGSPSDHQGLRRGR